MAALLFGPGDTAGLSPAEVTFDGSSSTVTWPFSSRPAGRPVGTTAGDGAIDVCMPAGVGMAATLKDTSGYFGRSQGPLANRRENESVRGRFVASGASPPVSPRSFRNGPAGDARNQRDPSASPRGPTRPSIPDSRAQAEQLRDEVAQLHHLLHQTRELHASEASRLHFQLQESKTAARREQALREEAEQREKAKSAHCDQLQREIGALKQLTKRHAQLGGGSSQGNSPPVKSLKGEDLRQLGTELQQIRQDSQDLRDLMAKQHDEELHRLREDLELTQQSSRQAHLAVSKLEAAQKQQAVTDAAASRKLEDRCLQLEHGTEIAEAKLTAAREELRAMEAAHKKLDEEMHHEQAAARQAQTHVERLALEQKSMALDQALQEEAQQRATNLTKHLAVNEVQREDLERQLREERYQLQVLQKQLDATALYHDRARERIVALEATAKSADLQQAVECASFWTEQDALRRSQQQAAASEERARELHLEVKSLESQQEYTRQLQLELQQMESKQEAAEQAQVELKDQHSTAESKVSLLQDAVSFLQQRVTQNAGTDAKLGEVQMTFRKVLARYKKLLASNADTHISTVTCESKLSEMEMLMRGVEEEQDALVSLQEQQQKDCAGAEVRERLLQSEAAEEMKETLQLRHLLRAAELRSEKQDSSLQRLMDSMAELSTERELHLEHLGLSKRTAHELQEEIHSLQEQLHTSSSLSEAHLGAQLRAENQAQSLQKKWLDERLQCQAFERDLVNCQHHLEEEQHLSFELDAKSRRHSELSEEAQESLRKLQIKNQRLELKVASHLRSLGQEEEAMKGMQLALEEAHQDLHALRTEQRTHLADSVGANVRVRAATESFEAMCQERAELHEELHDTKLRYCNSQLEHAAEKTESMAARGSLKQLEMKLEATMRSEHQWVQDCQSQAQVLQRTELSEKALTTKLMEVEAELQRCEGARTHELTIQQKKLQYEEAHVRDLQSALASLQSEHEGLLWQVQVERAQSEDRYEDLTKEVHELRCQEMELKSKVAKTDDLHSLLSKRAEESVYELHKAKDELTAYEAKTQAQELELRDCYRNEIGTAERELAALRRDASAHREEIAKLEQSKDDAYNDLLKEHKSLQVEEQQRHLQQQEFLASRVQSLEAAEHREAATMEHVWQVVQEATVEHQQNSLKHKAQLDEMKRGQQQLIEQLKQETNEQLSHLCDTNRALSAECRELLSASRQADNAHEAKLETIQKNLDEMKTECASYESAAENLRKHSDTVAEQLRLAQGEVKARSARLAQTEEQAAFQKQQHVLEVKELEDEYAKEAWQADKAELKIQELLAESSNAAAETVSRLAKAQQKEIKTVAKAEQLESILQEMRATLASSQEESLQYSRELVSLEHANRDFQVRLAGKQKLTGNLEAEVDQLEEQLKLSRTEFGEAEMAHREQEMLKSKQVAQVLLEVQGLQDALSSERSECQRHELMARDAAAAAADGEVKFQELQQQCQMLQAQRTETQDALQGLQALQAEKQKEICHLENRQEEEQKQIASLTLLRDQLDFNCRELNYQIQQLHATNKEEQVKNTALELRLEELEAASAAAAGEATVAAQQQDVAFQTLMARCQASENSVRQLEQTRKQLRAELAYQETRAAEQERVQQQLGQLAAVPQDGADASAAQRRTLEAQVMELAEMDFTLREVEMNSDRLQQYLEQSQSNLETQTEEKIRLEDQYAASRRQLGDTETQLREAQAQCAYWKSQQKMEEERARQWELKVEDLLRDIQCLQTDLAKYQGVSPSSELVFQQQNRTEVRQLQGELEASLQEVQMISSQAREQSEQLEHSRSVQQNLMAAQSHLDESYREAQGRLLDAEESLREFQAEHAQGNILRRSEARHYQEELLALRTVQTTMEAQAQATARSSEERIQKLSKKHSDVLEDSEARKVESLSLRNELEHLSLARKEEGEMFLHQEDATRHLEAALELQTHRTEDLMSENSNLHTEIEQLEMRCRGQDEQSVQTLQGALSIEKQLLAVKAKHGQLQEAYREQRDLRAKEAETGREMTKSIVDALKEELSQLREEAAAERAVREETDRIQEEVEEKLRRLHSEELQGIHFEHNALRSALHLQRRNSTEALEAQRWALRREKQLRKRRYALLMAASEELRGGLMRLKEATDDAAMADASVEDQDLRVAEELEQVKLDQQVLSESRAIEQEKVERLDEIQQQLEDERKAAHPNQHRIEELLLSESLTLQEVEQQEAVVAEDKRHFNEDYKKLEEAHAEERAAREKAEAFHQQVAAETQLLAVDLLKLQGVFEADGESESNFSQGSKTVREGRPLIEVASSEDEEGSETAEVGHVQTEQ